MECIYKKFNKVSLSQEYLHESSGKRKFLIKSLSEILNDRKCVILCVMLGKFGLDNTFVKVLTQ